MIITEILQLIPIAITALVLLMAVIAVYARSQHVTKREFFKIFKSTKFIQVGALIFAIVLTGFFSVFHHLQNKQTVTAIVALNFSEASQAQNSNGTRYNMSEIICDEVLEKAIQMGALENVTVKDLKKCLKLYPYYQGDVSDESKYHISTEFAVKYRASEDTQHLDAENVVTLIVNAYKEYYIDKYTDNYSNAVRKEKPDYSTMEYMDIVSYLEKESTIVLNYLYGLGDASSSFVAQGNQTFLSLAGQVYQFQKTQIEQNLRSLILQYGVARDKAEYIDRLSYYNKNTDFDMQKNAASYALCNEAVSIYAEEMTRIVLVPTWDGSGKYYMGRTKVGVDELSVMATVFSDRVASNNKQIMDNELVIDKMQQSSANKAVYAEVDELIASIDASIDAFNKTAIKAGREYASFQMNQCVALSLSGASLFDELKAIFAFACLAYLAALAWSVSRKFPKF